MPAFQDLTGKRFGRWLVVDRAPNRGKITCWNVICDCGTKKVVQAGNLTGGRSLSCGCIHHEQLADRNKVHGLSDHRLYAVWKSMNQRCRNPNAKSWKNYGGRGISICDRWNPSKGGSFENFVNDMPLWPGKPYSVDRIDNDGNYSPDNCRWATPKQQRANQRKPA